jgi:uncharacterized protein DUF3592
MLALTAGVGALVVAFGTWLLVDTARRLRKGVRSVATIVEYEREVPQHREFLGTDSVSKDFLGQEPSYYPVLEFIDTSGETRRVRTEQPGAEPLLNVGTRVKIVYDPVELGQAHLVSFRETWAGPIVLTTLGLALWSIGIWVVA